MTSPIVRVPKMAKKIQPGRSGTSGPDLSGKGTHAAEGLPGGL